MLKQEIKSRINWLWDRFWSGGLANPIVAIEQISYLLFIRRLEFVDNGLLIPDEKLKWSVFTQDITDNNELVLHFKQNVFPFIKNLKNSEDTFFQQMADATFEIEKGTLLREAVEVIDEIYIEIEKEKLSGQHFQDTQGDVYEYLLNATSQAGKNGQFRTPRHIIHLMCELLNPDLNDEICDVTSGTAGFLVGAYQYLITKYSSKNIQTDDDGFKRSVLGDKLSDRSKLNSMTFFGFDNDKTMVRIGMMNMIMHGITEPKIYKVDSLSQEFDDLQVITNNKNGANLKNEVTGEKYSCILANPPFTGKIDKSGLSDKLHRINSPQTELLFLDRIIHMLKPDGRAAVIVPDGVLFGSSKAQRKTREILLKDCCLDAVISLPSGVFNPYTAVKTSILIFTKKQLYSADYSTDLVWFYDIDSDGYSLDANRRKLKKNPLPKIVDDWRNRGKNKQLDRTKISFYIPIDEIINNDFELNLNQYKTFVYEDEAFEKPSKLLGNLLELETEIMNDLKGLKEMLS
ncbi:type I restriction enzyme M protein [Pedobacter sp. CAN_A7]|uniref:class I SAM-dependent DNA methyltransferase n=1 Tax=Pedobacter sp. CAN_A7 TaxID=2787722 RepID=UPI0018CA43F9